MLELEGVLIASELPFKHRDDIRKMGVRPYAKRFLDAILPLFDEKYLCTCCDEDNSLRIMRDVFGVQDIGYHHWKKGFPYDKASDYDRFLDSHIMHIEDGSLENAVAKRCLELGHDYICVPGWFSYHALSPDFEGYRKKERVLLDLIPIIRYRFQSSLESL